MKKSKRTTLNQKIVSLLLTLLLVLGALPLAPAFAQESKSDIKANAAPVIETTQSPEDEAPAKTTPSTEEKAPVQPAILTETEAAKNLTVLHTNDMHGSLASSGNTTIGADETAGIRQTIAQNTTTLLVDAGDATQGGTLAALSNGADIITLMNAAKYDAMALGNHEFDYSREILLQNAKNANFPMLSANTVYKDTQKPILEGVSYDGGTKTNNGQYTIIERDGLKIGVFGLLTPETASKTNPNGIQNIEFLPILPVAKDMIATLKDQGADVIVCLAHLGVDPSTKEEDRSTGLAAALGANSGLDMIIDGHSHTEYSQKDDTSGILIEQTGTASRNIGQIKVTRENNINTVSGQLIKAADAFANYKPDAEITALANQLIAANEGKLKPVIANSKTALWGGWIGNTGIARIGETNLGSLIADAMVVNAKSQLKGNNDAGTSYKDMPIVALENGGGVRATIKRGNITVGDSINVLPFGNTIAFKEVTPAILYEALENGVSKVTNQNPETGQITGADGRFPQISGMSFTYDPTKTPRSDTEKGNRVTAIYLEGSTQPLDRADTTTKIVLCSNDFEIAGGDGYSMLIGLKSLGEGGTLEEIFRAHLTTLTKAGGGSFLVPPTYGRIKTVGAYTPKPYTAYITVTGPERMGSLAGKTLEYQLDGGAVQTGILDENSVLKFDIIPDGPHSLRLGDADDVLVNNYSGDGLIIQGTGAVTATIKETLWISGKPQPKPNPAPTPTPTPVVIEQASNPKAANPGTGMTADPQQAGVALLSVILLTGAVSAVAFKGRR